jgi:hypothetical protein
VVRLDESLDVLLASLSPREEGCPGVVRCAAGRCIADALGWSCSGAGTGADDHRGAAADDDDDDDHRGAAGDDDDHDDDHHDHGARAGTGTGGGGNGAADFGPTGRVARLLDRVCR